MFVYSVKGSTVKLAGIICLAAVLAVSLLLLVPKNQEVSDAAANGITATSEDTEAVSANEELSTEASKKLLNYNKIKTNDDRVSFLAQFGWQVENEPMEEATVKIPREFDDVLNSYNKIQQHQGLDLSKYSGKEVERYTYKVTNYPDYSGTVTANLLVYRNRVIGGDVCSSDIDGFIKDLTFPESNGEATDTTVTEAPAETQSTESTDSTAPAPSENNNTAQPE